MVQVPYPPVVLRCMSVPTRFSLQKSGFCCGLHNSAGSLTFDQSVKKSALVCRSVTSTFWFHQPDCFHPTGTCGEGILASFSWQWEERGALHPYLFTVNDRLMNLNDRQRSRTKKPSAQLCWVKNVSPLHTSRSKIILQSAISETYALSSFHAFIHSYVYLGLKSEQ